MEWIVLGEDSGKIKLVSKTPSEGNQGGLLPKGSYITIQDKKTDTKFILRVDDSQQNQPYSPSPMIVDMDLSPLKQDQKCQNIVTAYRIKNISSRTDGFIDFIEPQSTARRSNQEEINIALGAKNQGPEVFLATVHSGENQLLIDDEGKFITTKLPIDMFYHQMIVCGKTGRGKTVATKYLAQYFVENIIDAGFEGAVLAINVKDVDFLKMDKSSTTKNKQILKEWEILGQKPHPIQNYVVYYPANTIMSPTKGVNPEVCQRITLNVRGIEPDALIGLLQGLSGVGAQQLPNIFRFWQEGMRSKNDDRNFTFGNFVRFFSNGLNDELWFDTLNRRGEASRIRLPRGTFDNIQRNLDVALEFFDNEDAVALTEEDILVPGKMSVIDVSGNNGFQFGSILLRHLLNGIVNAKSEQRSRVPILIIIDEVHHFYDDNSSSEALDALARICREGRSQKIGVIFSSQNPTDIPKGLSTVINTKLFFKSDAKAARMHGIIINSDEMESLEKGFAVTTIHDLPQVKILKIPLSYSGVFDGDDIDAR